MKSDDEFYVGYFPKAPAGTARLVRLTVAVAVAAVVVCGIAFVSAQRGFSDGVFEYGTTRTFTGTLLETPAPLLLGREEGSSAAETAFLLVAPFKHGAGELVAGLDGKSVRLQGTLIHRGRRSMIELAPGSVEQIAATAPAAPTEIEVGPIDLAGEIVDSKCWLGVMKPGDRKTHRECASLCIRGGIPPLFIATGREGAHLVALLTSPRDEPVNEAVLQFVAEPVRVRGTLYRKGDMFVLRADPATIARVR